jgi:hypothetical protein
MFRIWVPDLDSPSYFVAIAAVELGFFKQPGPRKKVGASTYSSGPATKTLISNEV